MNISEEALIGEVQKHIVLYDRGHPHYKKNHIREAAWEEIASTLRFDCEKCKKRWRTLRDTFIKSRRHEKSVPPWSKSGRKTKQWHLHDQMQFLVPYLDVTRPDADYETNQWSKEDSGDEDNTGEIETDEYQVKASASPSSPHSMSSLRSNSEDHHSMFIPSIEMCTSKRSADTSTTSTKKKCRLVQDLEAPSSNKMVDLLAHLNDPDVLFMLSQVECLSKLTPQKNRFAKIKIQQLLYDLEFGGDNFSDGISKPILKEPH